MCQTDGSWDSTQPECREYELIAKKGFCMSAHVLLNLLNALGKSIKIQGLPSMIRLINSIIHEHKC